LSAENFNKQKWARLNLSSYLIELGNAYFLGHGVNKSDTDALKSWQEAAKLGNKSALFNLGHCYYAGIGVAKDEAEAYGYWVLCAYDLNKYEEYDIQRPTYEFLEKSRKEGVKVENAELVKMCRQDFRWIFNTAADARTNAYMLEKVISVDAQQEGLKRGKEIQASLEVISEKFRSTKKDALLFQKAEFEKLRERAIAGDIKAQYELARSYLIGYKDLKFAPDEIEADKWYKSAADGGNVEAQIWLSEIFLRDKKTDEAVAWLRKASAQGNRQAHELMARCYLSGTGVPKSIIDAYAYLNISNFVGEDKPLGLADLELKMSPEEKRMGLQRTKELHVEIDGRIKHAPNTQILIGLALQRGNKPDQYGLGSFFQVGPVDQVEAVRWFRKAAEQGDPNGEYYVGRAYDSGKGVPEDKAEGVRWYRKAAEKGLAIAQYMLGNAYETGEGVPKDEIEAYAYFNLAGATDKDARKRIASMEETMQPNIRLLGQQRTRELRKEIEGKMETMEDLRKAVQMEKQLKGI
jgi:TPR repeat protein